MLISNTNNIPALFAVIFAIFVVAAYVLFFGYILFIMPIRKRKKEEIKRNAVISNSELIQQIIKSNEEYKFLYQEKNTITQFENLYFDEKNKYGKYETEKAIEYILKTHDEITLDYLRQLREKIKENDNAYYEYIYKINHAERISEEKTREIHVGYYDAKNIENEYLRKVYSKPNDEAFIVYTHYASPTGRSTAHDQFSISVDDLEAELLKRQNRQNRQTTQKEQTTEIMEYRDFLNKYNNIIIDRPGCYVILFFNQQPNIYYSNYDNVYVGQSMTVFARVRNHLTGHGNGDVYAEVKYNAPCGEQIFVVFVPCDAKDLNDKEKELIRQFNAQQSFNKTAGGARERF